MGRSRDTEYDVIVVGSGPAGVSTAIHLTKLDPSIKNRLIILEKETHPRKKICGGGISVYADYWLQRLGIQMTISSLALKRICIAIDQDGYVEYHQESGGLRTVIREELDEALVRKAIDLGIEVVQNEPVISFSYRGEAVAVQTPQRSLTTHVLVGADGARSIIHRKLCRNSGIRGPRNICGTLRCMTRADGLNPTERKGWEAVVDFACTFRHGIPGYTWSLPIINQGLVCLNTGVVSFLSSQKQGSLLRKILAEFLAARGISPDEGRIEGWPIRLFHPSSIFSANRVLLVGDAAGIDPLWGEGISFSLGYGDVAADSIFRALKSKDFSFTTYKDRLLEHEIGKELMNRLHWADKLYRSHTTENARNLLLSLLMPRRNG